MSEQQNSLHIIFVEALEIADAQQRAVFLSKACGADSALRQEIEELIQALAAAGKFLPEQPALTGVREALLSSAQALGPGGAVSIVPVSESAGDRIGRYKLLQQIGEGGCGVVYMAEQEEPVRRRVAIKIIKLGMDTKSMIGRFEVERQALAMMDHPNIAKVFDAGSTETGRPFFVMELVSGTRITKYCDQRCLSKRERLELFVQVCYAVQHAHQKGIIHRDLKPSNILVTENDGRPVPKVIDFGIAKTIEGQLSDVTLFTAFEQLLGTPAYMSPEQAELVRVDVDTRSDVYSLGVLLYELLTGGPPFETRDLLVSGLEQLRRTIREEEPLRPSARLAAMTKKDLAQAGRSRRVAPQELIASIAGDLNWITMKCLEKDRDRRYQSAGELAADINRHLSHKPVLARSATTLYRLQKFVRRNKTAVATATALVLVVLCGALFSAREAVRARTAERKAELEAGRARVAEGAMRESLRDSYLAQARAGRWSGRVGRRFGGLELIRKAAAIRPSLELGNEAIACMALSDLRQITNWGAWNPGGELKFFDGNLERAAYQDGAGTIHICRASDGQEFSQLRGYQPPLRHCVFSHDEAFVAINCGASGEQFEIVTLKTAKVIFKHEQPRLQVLSLSHDDHWVAISYDQAEANYPVVVYEVPSGKLLASFAAGRLLHDLRFDPVDSTRLLISDSSPTVQVCEWRSGKVIQKFEHPDWVEGTAWHPGGEVIATACGDNNVRLWNVKSGAELAILGGHDWAAIFVSFSPDGNFLLSRAWGGKMQLWDPYSKADLLNMSVFRETTLFSQTGNRFATLEDDYTWKLWEIAESSGYQHLYGEVAGVEITGSCVFSADSRWLLSTGDRSLRLWDAHSGKEAVALEGVFSKSFAMRGGTNLYVFGKGKIYTVEEKPGAASPTFKLITTKPASIESAPFELMTDGSQFSARAMGVFHLLSLPKPREPIRLTGPAHRRFVEFSPDSRLAASWSDISTNTMIWNLEMGELARTFATTPGGAWTIFSPNGRILITADYTQYSCWTVGDWNELWKIPRSAFFYFGHMTFSPDGQIAALAVSRSVVLLVDAQTGRELARLESPEGKSTSWMAFSPDGSKLAITGVGQIQFWDLKRIRSQLAAMNLDWQLPP